MSVEAVSGPVPENNFFDTINPSIVINLLPHLGLDKRQYDVVNSYYLFRDGSSSAGIAHTIGVPLDVFEQTLQDVGELIKERVKESGVANRPPQARPAPPESRLRSVGRMSFKQQYLREIESERYTNSTPQNSNFSVVDDRECAKAPIEDANKFISPSESVQRKMITTYCLKCALMEVCGQKAIENGFDDMVYGGYTTRALKILATPPGNNS